jgi:predicted alpha/beta hydrolase
LAPEPLTLQAADGYAISGCAWREPEGDRSSRPVVIINPANAVQCRYYFRLAAFLCQRGCDVIAYDYRGIGRSRPSSLRGFEASWLDWGRLDFEAALRHAECAFPGQPIQVIAHSIGGFLLGLAPSNHLIQRVFTVGAQYAYWPDYAADRRLRMLVKWHLVTPLLTAIFGYFPGQSLGWLEDMPRGVVRDWVFSRARFERTWRGRARARHPDNAMLVRQFAAVTAPILALSVTDDEFGTIAAVERLLAYFDRSAKTHLRISPASIGEPAIGHFGFFNSRLQSKLWDIALQWLKFGRVPAGCPGVLVSGGEPLR